MANCSADAITRILLPKPAKGIHIKYFFIFNIIAVL